MEIEVKQILLQLLNFGILAAVLGKFLFKPVLKLLDARSQKIADGMAAAESNLKLAAQLEKKQADKLAEATKKAAAILALAKAESKKLGEDLIAQAKSAATSELAKQKLAFQKELAGEESALKQRLSALVVETTKSVLSSSLSASELKSITTKELAKLK